MRSSSPGRADLTFTGSVDGTFTQGGTVACLFITDQGPAEFDLSVQGSVAGGRYGLLFTVHRVEGAAGYPITPTENKVLLSLADGSTIWDGYQGTLTLGDDRRSGTVDIDLRAGSSGGEPDKPIHISGPFACAGT